MPNKLELTTKTEANKAINTAKTLAESTVTNTSDLAAVLKALREQVPFKIIVAK
jgi:hypothetical protein